MLGILWLGAKPAPLLDRMQPSIDRLLEPLARELQGPPPNHRAAVGGEGPGLVARSATPASPQAVASPTTLPEDE
jgi:hypothetical protein